MTLETRQLRGWKEIAAYLKASERTVKRWEAARRLPVRRITGASRDVVTAYPDELDGWLRPTIEPTPNELGPPRPEFHCSNAPRHFRKLAAGLSVLGLVILCLASYGVSKRLSVAGNVTAGSAASGQSRVARESREVLLRITTPRGMVTRMKVRDAECAGVWLSGHERVELCARLLGDGLLLDVVAPGDSGGGVGRISLRLDPVSRVRVQSPVQLDVEWLHEPSPRSSPPVG